MHDIVAERAGVPAAVLVGVKARQHLRAEVFISEQAHRTFFTFCNLTSGGASERKLECCVSISLKSTKKNNTQEYTSTAKLTSLRMTFSKCQY